MAAQVKGSTGLAVRLHFSPSALYEAKGVKSNFLNRYRIGADLTALAAQIRSPDVRFVVNELIPGERATPDEVDRGADGGYASQAQETYADAFAQLGSPPSYARRRRCRPKRSRVRTGR